jgi:hypothetical protein
MGENDILFSEIGYHPLGDEAKEEFIELYNSGIEWVDLSGWTFTAGIEFTFGESTVISPGGYLVVARNKAHLSASRQISNVVGDFKEDLSNTGEILELRNRTGRVAAWLHYHDGHRSEGALWPTKADGKGPSLELTGPHPDWHRPWYWASSRVPGGTPGRENSRFQTKAERRKQLSSLAASGKKGEGSREAGTSSSPSSAEGKGDGKGFQKLRINEARLADPDPFVEIVSEGSSTLNLEGLRLTGDPSGSGGIQLTGSVAKKKPFLLDAEKVRPLLSPRPERLSLLDTATGEIIDSLSVKKACPPQGSLGRFPDGKGGAMVFPRGTPGAPNAAPPASEIVINEINYNGLNGAPDEEFVELFNRGKSAVALKGWKLKGGVSCAFPDEAMIPAGGYAVASADPKKLAARLSADEAKQVFGPFKGKLANSEDTVVVQDALGNVVDHVHYRDKAPWPNGADGRGFSLELLRPDLDNRWPEAWTTGGPEGTPCRKNARVVKTLPPVITGVRHEPPIPDPEDAALIHAHVIDTSNVAEMAVIYRDVDGNSKPVKKTMSDNGQQDDGAAHDGHYTARLPKFRAGALIGFSIVLRDSGGRLTRYPAGDQECYFQVEPKKPKSSSTPGMPVYRILMPRDSWEKFQRTQRRDDTLHACTMIASVEGRGVNETKGDIFYEASIRFRGSTSRMPVDGRMSYRLRLEGGGNFDGRHHFIFNAYSSFRQKAGGDAMRLAGLPVSDIAVVRLKTPAFDDGRYVDVEVVESEFLKRRLGTSARDLFRCVRGRPFGADLGYHGADPAPYLNVYRLVNNKDDKKISGLLKLLEALDSKDEETYPQKVEKLADVAEWALYFAANNVLGNTEGGLTTGEADDYFITQRPSDGKFILIPWDQDSTFDATTVPLFRPGFPAVRRFLQNPKFAPLYLRAAREILDGPLSRSSFERRQDYWREVFHPEEISVLDRFVETRQVFLRERYPLGAPATLQAEGVSHAGFGSRTFLSGSAREVWLVGYVDPAMAAAIKVGGETAEFDPVTGRWSTKQAAAAFSPGPNPLWVELLGPKGEALSVHSLNVERVDSIVTVPPVISGEVEWKSGSGPYFLPGPVAVQQGATLRIGAGVNVICGPGSSLLVRGSLLAQGSAGEPITFRPSDWEKSWSGIRFFQAGTNSRPTLSYCRFEGGRAAGGFARRGTTGPAIRRAPLGRTPFPLPPGGDVEIEEEEPRGGALDGAFLRLEGSRVNFDHCVFRSILGTAVGGENSAIEIRDSMVSDGRNGLLASGGSLLVERTEFRRLFADGLSARLLAQDGSKIVDSACRDVLGTGISIEGGKLTLERVLVQGSAEAVSVSGGARVRGAHLTLAGDGVGLSVDQPRRTGLGWAGSRRASAEGRSRVEVSSSILGPAHEPVVLEADSEVSLSHSLVAPVRKLDHLPAGEKLSTGMPRFVSPQDGDFRLAGDSPGKGSAPDGSDLGAGR